MMLFKRNCVFLMIALLSACGKHPHQYNGYIDADLTYLSADYPGRLAHLLVVRGQPVQKHQLLFKLEQQSEQDHVVMSQDSKDNLLADRKGMMDQLHYAEVNYHRTITMMKQHAASQNDLDLAKRDWDVLKNQLQGLDAQINSSTVDTANRKWQLEHKEGYSTDKGIIFDTYFTKGEYVAAGQPILALITRQHIKVIFFVPEKALSSIHLNQKVKLSTDGNPSFATGTIRYISNTAQYTPPIIYSREERQALVFRVEAHIDHPQMNQLHLGQPVSLEWV
ncbi:MAG: HlyD family efflux transporter periplasmic adaptor subunit [Gammaproteobacteria bacterium]|nr:HlyD family efflux transporter periplasmic adaptor subunit [Gammaproteobacteria bacterium]